MKVKSPSSFEVRSKSKDLFKNSSDEVVVSKFELVSKREKLIDKNAVSQFILRYKSEDVFCTLNRAFLFLSFFVSGCTDDSTIKTNDGFVEPRLEEVTGVTTEKIKSISPEQELTIDELYAYAVERTERIALKEEAIQQADSQKAAAFASFFPSLSLVYNKFYRIPGPNSHFNPYYTEPNPLTGGFSTSSLPPTVGPGTRLLLTIPILNGVSQYTTYKAAGALTNVRMNEARYESGRLYLEIAQAYYSENCQN
ncbi:hypothetical protein LEP1GSC060_3324 [Leptospira weilii serovar Ranarum str. ICFT]|uniref:Outer membrane efflux protein n=1 Tax=Leptospira weilii serovar Ranarum str. ICFT TaxID=1218598 RepID=N1WMA1_9LEPT|nr:hypothetical protein LEP1GSC060_3324 [Leptospira weilii serovar Ranarum str. ICFT]